MPKILIVDDDPLTSSIYSEKLRAEGFEVLAAHDGQAAWDLIQSGEVPDLVFAGIIMPRMGGFELVEKMQADSKLAEIPVAMFSHHNRPEDKERAEKLRVDDFITRDSTAPVEVVKRLKLLVGAKEVLRIKIDPAGFDAQSFMMSTDRLQGTKCADCSGDKILELHSMPDKQVYKIRLRCSDCENK